MSMFVPTTLGCPSCGEPVEFRAVLSVNADRRPDLRAAILAESFQRQPCPKCSLAFRLAPDLSYLDVGRGQWLASHPVADVGRWTELETRDRAAFDRAYGPTAPPPARAIGANLKPRMTFGWAGLREKILAADRGLDDVTLELTKLAIVRGSERSPLRDDTELRLVATDGPTLVLAWLNLFTEQLVQELQVPLDLYREIAADENWQPLREELSAGMYVDMNRLIVPGGAAAA